MSKPTPINDLSCAAVDCKPIDFNWSEGYGETWEFWAAEKCDKCGIVLVGQGENERHRDLDSESGCDGYVSLSAPMMSYYYPVEILDVEEAARKLVNTCLCVVRIGDETGLALTGGGMNLSWEICEAFMLLGFLPPLHFCELPGMAGKDVDSARNKRIIAGCIQSCKVAASWAESKAKRLRETVAQMRKYERKAG